MEPTQPRSATSTRKRSQNADDRKRHQTNTHNFRYENPTNSEPQQYHENSSTNPSETQSLSFLHGEGRWQGSGCTCTHSEDYVRFAKHIDRSECDTTCPWTIWQARLCAKHGPRFAALSDGRSTLLRTVEALTDFGAHRSGVLGGADVTKKRHKPSPSKSSPNGR